MARKKSEETTAKRPAAPRKTGAGQRRTRRTGATASAESAAPRRAGLYTEAQVRECAYYLYLKRQGGSGDAVSDWLQAERELNG
jgi:hypothetical protein